MSVLRVRGFRRGVLFLLGAAAALGSAAALPGTASACGCFTPPDVSQPLVQAGEEIVFIVENGKVTMHVRLRYSGRAGDFGWLLPMPAVPTNSMGAQGIDVGVDELFDQLEQRTQPTYILQRNSCNSGGGGIGCGASAPSALGADDFNSADGGTAPQTPLVKQDSIGPYDFAILKADDKTAMLNWLSTNKYVVPTGTDSVVNQYIRPGGFFLALKLKAGATSGDMQPVVISYQADLPMIPLVLTSVGAAPHMGILVWVLGSARAIPRNYSHTVINDSQLDWLNQVKNYNDVIIKAVGEATDKHSFVTEYAGASQIMSKILDDSGRFDILSQAVSEHDPARYIQLILPQVQTDGYIGGGYFNGPVLSHVRSGFAMNGQLTAALGAYVPMPSQLVTEGVTPSDYYTNIQHYLVDDRAARPAVYAEISSKLAAFDPAIVTKDLTDRIATPTLSVGAVFTSGRLPKLTRLYTTISPEDMTADPVFSFNRDLPDYSNVHNGTFDPNCGNPAGRNAGGGRVTTDEGFRIQLTADEVNSATSVIPGPASQRIEHLMDTGQPVVVTDNSVAIRQALDMAPAQGCTAAERSRQSSAAPFLSVCAATLASLLLIRRRRRQGSTSPA